MAKYTVADNDGKTLHVAPFFIDALIWASQSVEACSIEQGDMTHMRNMWAITRSGANELSMADRVVAYEAGYFFEV